MNLEEIKKEAALHTYEDQHSLSLKIAELKTKGVSFLGCIAFVQVNQNLSLSESKDLLLQLDAYNESEKKKVNAMLDVMRNDFEQES